MRGVSSCRVPAPVSLNRLLAAGLATALIIGGLAACGGLSPARTHPAARSVREILELRSEKSADPRAYAPFFERSEVATQLARSAADATTGQRVIPAWEAPYVSKETTSAVEVVVRWGRGHAPGGFPAATVFVMKRRDGRWVAADALEIADEAAVPKAAGE